MITGWRYWYRRYLGWLPVQFCVICGRAYWGGWPHWWINPGHFSKFPHLQMTWQAAWKDCCSQACCDEDHRILEAATRKAQAMQDRLSDERRRE